MLSVPSPTVSVKNIGSSSASLGKPEVGADIFGVELVSGLPRTTEI